MLEQPDKAFPDSSVWSSGDVRQCWLLPGMKESNGPCGMGSFQRGRPWERQPVKITIYSACCLAGWWKDPRAARLGSCFMSLETGCSPNW